MFIPVYLFWDYISPFPWYLGPILQILGLFCLWVTRFTARFYPKWGDRYYLFSAIIRPVGIIFIAWAWLEIYSVQPDFLTRLGFSGGLIFGATALLAIILCLYDKFLRGFFIYSVLAFWALELASVSLFHRTLEGDTLVVWISVVLLALVWAFVSIFNLGLRRSFFYVRVDDPLITDGLYEYQRHPQLMAAAALIFGSIMVMSGNYNHAILDFQAINFLYFVAGIYIIVIGEERDLAERFEDKYFDYCEKTPRFVGTGPKKRTMEYNWIFAIGTTFLSMALFASDLEIKSNLLHVPVKEHYRMVDAGVKSVLASIATSSIAYYAETNNWGETFKVIDWSSWEGYRRNAYFLNSCDEVIPNSDGFRECPSPLKEYFEKHPFNGKDGFHAAGIHFPLTNNGGIKIRIWVIDWEKNPTILTEYEMIPSDPKQRAIMKRRAPFNGENNGK